MLGEKFNLTVNIGEKKIDFNLTIRSLKNLGELTRKSPFIYLRNFINEENKEESNSMLVNIMLAFTNGDLTVKDLPLIVEQADLLKSYIMLLMVNETVSEIEEEKEDVGVEDNEVMNDEKAFRNWCDLYNYYYYISISQLHMNQEQFLNSTLRELKTMDKLNRDYLKNIIINYYIDVNKVRNDNGKKEVETLKATKQNKARIKNLLLMQ